MAEIVRIEGLRETQRALRQMGNGVDRELKANLKGVAEKVAAAARGRVPVRSGRARSSIKAGAQQKGSYVQGGRATVPYYGWLDFGSRTPRTGRPRSIGPWSGSGKGPTGGRFIYPALDDNRRDVERRSLSAVKVARKKAGL